MGRGHFGQTRPLRRHGTATVSSPHPHLSGGARIGFFPYLLWFVLCDSGGASMDPPPRIAGGERRSCHYCLLTFSLSVGLCFSSVFVFGFFAVSGDRFPVPHRPTAVAAQCKVVSISVDIRSAEVCEVGFLNFKAKNVLHGSRKTDFDAIMIITGHQFSRLNTEKFFLVQPVMHTLKHQKRRFLLTADLVLESPG